MKKLILFIPFFILLGLTASIAGAQSQQPKPVTDDQVNTVAKQLYCPVCENIPLDVCPTQACAEWRDLIRSKLAVGWSADQIKTYFAQQYGDRVLAEPPTRGLNWLVYILPPIAILAGAYLLYRAFKAWSQPALQPETAISGQSELDSSQKNIGDVAKAGNQDNAKVNAKYIAQLEEELKKR